MTPLRRAWRPSAGVSILYDRRTIIAVSVLVLAIFALGVVTMTTGQYQLTLAEIWRILTAPDDPVGGMIVLGLRLPRLLAAIFVGAALGVAGAVFQSIARNPLASPDIVGFTTGSASGALVIILIAGQGGMGIAVGALIGGFATALLVYLIALERGVVGQKLIVVGIAIAAMLGAANDFLITRAELERAQAAKTWLFGSLHATGWEVTTMLALGCLVLLPAILAFSDKLRILEMGDDLASALGLPLGRSKLVLLSLAVGLTALAIAGAGPIGFVALAAPQLARRLTRTPGMGVVSSATMGSLLVVAADLLAQRLLAPLQIPVGLLTGAMGGIYLIWLLAREWRKGDGATRSPT
ncbi:FecCD family ABC transporter permease [Pelagibacterium mangrovi]|uniref:FecCD family ABC transporter permease n=1 Tax=Pelagibacterium mangrovi TaxID=3119828 RepID=UPI002FC7A80C